MKYRAIFALTCLFPLLAEAQAKTYDQLLKEVDEANQTAPAWLNEQEKVFRRHAVGGDGATNPEAIPFGVAAENLFLLYADEVDQPDRFRQDVQSTVRSNDADFKRISDLAASANSFAETVRNEEARSLDAACKKVVAAEPWNSIDAVLTAREFQAIETTRMQLIEEHYKTEIDALSASARTSLLSLIDTNIKPKMRWSTIDNVGVAMEIPDDWLYSRRASCERWLARPLDLRSWRIRPAHAQ